MNRMLLKLYEFDKGLLQHAWNYRRKHVIHTKLSLYIFLMSLEHHLTSIKSIQNVQKVVTLC